MDEIVWIECYRGIAYSSLTGPTPIVLARARTHFCPKGVLVYCNLETYDAGNRHLKQNFKALALDIDLEDITATLIVNLNDPTDPL